MTVTFSAQFEKRPIRKVYEERWLNLNMFYRWQKECFENRTYAFKHTRSSKVDAKKHKIKELERKLADHDEGLLEQMTSHDVLLVLQRAHELYPQSYPRIISDNGSQFISRDLKELICLHGMSHERTSPYYPQSNGKQERWHKTLKSECIRPGCPLSMKDARRLVAHDVDQYNNHRLQSAIGYVTPRAMLEQRAEEILRERDRKLEQAREHRRQRHQNHRRTHSVLRTESNNTNSSKPAESPVSRRISARRAEGEVMPSGT